MDNNTSEEALPELAAEDRAFLIKAIWSSLQAPEWKKNDNEGLFIDIGKAIVRNKKLHELDDKTFQSILPHLNTIAESLGRKLLQRTISVASKLQENSAATEQPASPPTDEKPSTPEGEKKKEEEVTT